MTPQDILSFWFAPQTQARWFDSTPAFDALIREDFGETYRRAAAGELAAWRQAARSGLALVIVLDQLPRNMFRGEGQAFATDALALEMAGEAVAQGFDLTLDKAERQFLYLPFMHAEDSAMQEEGLRLYTALGEAQPLDFMRQHLAIIAKFGRFPYRNAMLGRPSTAEELASAEIDNPF